MWALELLPPPLLLLLLHLLRKIQNDSEDLDVKSYQLRQDSNTRRKTCINDATWSGESIPS
jgi:hypothetical protein